MARWLDSDECWKEPPLAEREEAAKQFDGDVSEFEDDRMFDMYDKIGYKLNVLTANVGRSSTSSEYVSTSSSV